MITRTVEPVAVLAGRVTVDAGRERARPHERPQGEGAIPPQEAVQIAEPGADKKGAPLELKKTARLPDVPLRELSMRVSPETNRVVIEVIDSETKAVVRRIPPEEAIDLLRHLPQKRAVFVDREG